MKDEPEVSDEMLARRLREAAAKVKAGEQARAERAKLIDEAGRRDWTREAIAETGRHHPPSGNKAAS
ncbi:hypothetical protein GCM10018952_44020 [Streptosporangium vulgare]